MSDVVVRQDVVMRLHNRRNERERGDHDLALSCLGRNKKYPLHPPQAVNQEGRKIGKPFSSMEKKIGKPKL